jgi:hypothetical protein
MVKVTYSLFLETKRFVFSIQYQTFDPSLGLISATASIMSPPVVAFKDQLTDSWIAIPKKHIEEKGVFQIAKIQEID